MEQTKIKLTFSIFGDSFNPEHLTQNIGIEGISFHKKGDAIPNRENLTWKETSWSYSTGFVETLFFDELTDHLVHILETKIDYILPFVKELELEVKLFVVVEIVDEVKPAIYVNRKILDFLNLFKAEIDFDLYLIDSNE